MKNLLVIPLLISVISTFAQDKPCDTCKKCDDKIVTATFLKQFTDDAPESNVISRNWGEFFGENLEDSLPPNTKSANVISIKFDALGCIYPDKLDGTFADKFYVVNDKIKNTKFEKNSFYSLSHFNSEEEAIAFHTLIVETVPATSRETITKIVPMGNKILEGEEVLATSVFDYMETWNDVFLPNLTHKINTIIAEKKVDRIVIFCHGYNVPYSLAQIQANIIIDRYAQELGAGSEDFNKILFLKVFWPSLDKKWVKFSSEGMDFGNSLAFSTTRYYKYITNRAFNVGLNLRRLINTIDFAGRFDVIAHSSGSTAVSAMLINPVQKINVEKENSFINQLYVRKFRENGDKYKLLDKEVNVFLNASSMPGVGTFNSRDLNSEVQKKYRWIVGHNRDDKVLNKKLSFIRFPDSFGNSRLGGNHKDEVNKTKVEVFDNPLKIRNNFEFPRLGYQGNLFGHDFFCYLLQNNFQNEFSSFIRN